MTNLYRFVAAALLAIPLGRWFAAQDASQMAQYRTLSHDALLAVLQDRSEGGPAASYIGAFLALSLAFFLVLGVSLGIERAVRYLRAR